MLPNLGPRLSYFISDFYPYLIILFVSFSLFLFLVFKIAKNKTLTFNKKGFLLMLSTTVLSFVVVFSMFEAYFRFVYDEPDGLGFLKTDERWHKRHVVYNSYFVRDRDFDVVKQEGIVRIGVIGDSITMGRGIESPGDRFSNLLERKLRDAGKSVQVYNLGKSGYDTQAEIEEYKKVEHLDFDILVWEYFLNDINPAQSQRAADILNANRRLNLVTGWLFDKSFLADFLYWRFSSVYQKTLSALRTSDLNLYANDQILEAHKGEIKNFLDDLKAQNKKVVVIIFPSIFLIGGEYEAENIHEVMGKYFHENQANYVIDLLPDLKNQKREDLIAGKFDAHPNESVHALAASKLFEAILPLLSE